MALEMICKRCGREFQPSHERIIAGRWQLCEQCRAELDRDKAAHRYASGAATLDHHDRWRRDATAHVYCGLNDGGSDGGLTDLGDVQP